VKRSPSVVFRATWIVGTGALIAATVVYGFATSRWACLEGSGNSFACDLSNIAVAIGFVIAALHLLAGSGIWRGRLWGAALGALLALLGVVACISMAADEPKWLMLPAAAGYLATSLVLARAIVRRWDQGRRMARR
jgi:hypothetical protein